MKNLKKDKSKDLDKKSQKTEKEETAYLSPDMASFMDDLSDSMGGDIKESKRSRPS